MYMCMCVQGLGGGLCQCYRGAGQSPRCASQTHVRPRGLALSLTRIHTHTHTHTQTISLSASSPYPLCLLAALPHLAP